MDLTRRREIWRARLSAEKLKKLVIALAIGAIGGAIGAAIHLPLAWMMGSMFLCMGCSLAGMEMEVPVWFRTLFMGIIGIFLGESFGALTAQTLARWPVTMAAAVLYVPVATCLCYLLFRYVAHMSRGGSLLSGLPGGVTAVAIFAQETGIDERRVALAQAMRLAVVVMMAPIIAFGILGLPAPEAGHISDAPLITGEHLAIIIAGSLLCGIAIARIGLPLPYLLGPLIASALLRPFGVVEGSLPPWLVETALVVSGAAIGSRFAGTKIHVFLQVAFWGAIGTVLMMAVSAAFAWGAVVFLGEDFFASLLAFAPGGVAEMSLIAIAIDADPAFVATHHVVRIFAILLALPIFAGKLRSFLAEEKPKL